MVAGRSHQRADAGEPTLTRARALHSAALALRKTREYAQARRLLEESLSVYRLLGDNRRYSRPASTGWPT